MTPVDGEWCKCVCACVEEEAEVCRNTINNPLSTPSTQREGELGGWLIYE